jgi:hypothetical protein
VSRKASIDVLRQRPSTTANRVILNLLGGDAEYLERFHKVKALSRRVRSSQYLLTDASSIRCEGHRVFQHDFDQGTNELEPADFVREFAKRERDRGITHAIIGGESTLILDRIAAFVDAMDYVTVSTNGLRRLPRASFENIAVQISLFGGSKLDDRLRAIKPGGQRFMGLFDQALRNYEGDPRACFVYTITEDDIDDIADTVRRIHENGNRVSFDFYSKYHQHDPLRMQHASRLLEEALCVKELFPDTVLSHPYFIQAIITGESHWGRFGYDVCPNFSVDHPENAERLVNGNPYLPRFNAWAADCQTVNFCSTAGHCEDCRDSQPILNWLIVNFDHFRETGDHLKTWIEISESYWKQFCWALYEAPTTSMRPRVTLPLAANGR